MRLVASLLGLSLLLAAAPAAAGHARTVLPVDGTPRQAALAGLEPDRLLWNGARPHALPLADLVEWGCPPELPVRPWIVLADGGLLVAEPLEGDARALRADSDEFGAVELPTSRVAAAVIRPPATAAERDILWDRIAAAARPDDHLILANGDALQGRLARLGQQDVELAAGAGPIRIERSRLEAIFFAARPAESRAGLRLWIGTREGSRLLAQRLEADNAALRAVLAAGPSIRLAPADIVWLQPEGGRATYLSDLSPTGYRHVPYLDLPWPYRSDRSVTGTMLRAGGRLWAKGLGMHSASRLTYMLQEPYDRFQADLAIDDQAAGGGSVRFRVFVDGREKFTSPTVRGGDAPLPVSLDLKGAKRLDLVVDFADRADQLDRADWLNARLIK